MRSRVTQLSTPTMLARPLVGFLCVALLLLSVSAPATAHAQLGKLKKMGADAVKDKAKEAAGVKDPDGSAAKGGARIDYAITEERLTGIMNYLAPLVDEAERQAAQREAMATYKKQMDAANECVNKASQTATPDVMAAASSKGEAMMAKLTDYNERLTAATASNNHRTRLALSDSAMVLQIQYAALMFPTLKCPAVPYKPAAILDAEVASITQTPGASSSARTTTVPAAARASLTTGQFGRIRERMAIWLLVQSGDLPATSESFTDEERALLTRNNDALKRYGPLFKNGIMQWANWGDITAW